MWHCYNECINMHYSPPPLSMNWELHWVPPADRHQAAQSFLANVSCVDQCFGYCHSWHRETVQLCQKSGSTFKFLVVDDAGFDLAAYICKRHAGRRVRIDRPEKLFCRLRETQWRWWILRDDPWDLAKRIAMFAFTNNHKTAQRDLILLCHLIHSLCQAV